MVGLEIRKFAELEFAKMVCDSESYGRGGRISRIFVDFYVVLCNFNVSIVVIMKLGLMMRLSSEAILKIDLEV